MKKLIFPLACLLTAVATTAEVAAFSTEPSESLEVWTGPLTLQNDGTSIATLTIYQKDDIDYTAFNMAIVVPEGITVAKVKQGRDYVDDIHLTDRASATHNITCGMPDSNTIKIISSSPSLQNYYPTTEDGVDPYALFTIGLIASPSVAPGSYDIELCDIKFVLESADAYILPNEPLVFPIKVEGEVTGMRTVTADPENEQLYDLQGRPVKSENAEGIIIRNGEKILR